MKCKKCCETWWVVFFSGAPEIFLHFRIMSLPEMLCDLLIKKQPTCIPVEGRCLLQSLQVFKNLPWLGCFL